MIFAVARTAPPPVTIVIHVMCVQVESRIELSRCSQDSPSPCYHRVTHVVCVQVESRIELSRCSQDSLSSYANASLPFATWLKGVESRIADLSTLPRAKDLLLLEKDEMKVRMSKQCVSNLLSHVKFV